MLDIYLHVYGLFTLETDTGLSLVSAENLFGDTKLKRGLSTIKAPQFYTVIRNSWSLNTINHHKFTLLSGIPNYLIP